MDKRNADGIIAFSKEVEREYEAFMTSFSGELSLVSPEKAGVGIISESHVQTISSVGGRLSGKVLGEGSLEWIADIFDFDVGGDITTRLASKAVGATVGVAIKGVFKTMNAISDWKTAGRLKKFGRAHLSEVAEIHERVNEAGAGLLSLFEASTKGDAAYHTPGPKARKEEHYQAVVALQTSVFTFSLRQNQLWTFHGSLLSWSKLDEAPSITGPFLALSEWLDERGRNAQALMEQEPDFLTSFPVDGSLLLSLTRVPHAWGYKYFKKAMLSRLESGYKEKTRAGFWETSAYLDAVEEAFGEAPFQHFLAPKRQQLEDARALERSAKMALASFRVGHIEEQLRLLNESGYKTHFPELDDLLLPLSKRRSFARMVNVSVPLVALVVLALVAWFVWPLLLAKKPTSLGARVVAKAPSLGQKARLPGPKHAHQASARVQPRPAPIRRRPAPRPTLVRPKPRASWVKSLTCKALKFRRYPEHAYRWLRFRKGVARCYVLGISGGQKLHLTTSRKASFAVEDTYGQPLKPLRSGPRSASYAIPSSTHYKVHIYAKRRLRIKFRIPSLRRR